MRFYEKLNEYIALLGCKAKDVGAASGISAATLSRYRSGERLPDVDSEAFEKLCVAIAEIAKEKNVNLITTSLTGREAPDIIADFAFNEEGTKVQIRTKNK